MAIYKLKPACKDYIWGGDKLIKDFHKEFDGQRLAETWELSCHFDGPSIVEGTQGMTLPQLISENGREMLGENCKEFREFPILVKLIDAKSPLSIQVHPSNDYALRTEGQYGKTEMWYIVDCDPDAFLYYGFEKELSREEFVQHIQNQTLQDVLHKVYVKKGDVLFIEAGTIHAIGKNIVIAEIQQNSNLTYRVYDYGRTDSQGRCRDLHIEKALAVTRRSPVINQKSFSPHIAVCDYFTVDKLFLDGKHMKKMNGFIGSDSFVNILVLEGKGIIWSSDEVVKLQKGDSIFLPANSGEMEISGNLEALMIRV